MFQALSIRPDLLSPAAMVELQKLCDKVPSFDSGVAMRLVADELGRPWQEVYAELTPEPIAAASLGQVYKGRLKNGDVVAVKVLCRCRKELIVLVPGVLEGYVNAVACLRMHSMHRWLSRRCCARRSKGPLS